MPHFRSAVLAAFLFLFTMLIPAQAQEGGRVVLVLDASGSMWGQIDGKTKMEIAKDVVGSVVGSWKPEDELGLVAYGHREKGSCADIEVLREAGPLDGADYMLAVNALNPKGKTPMTAAVRMAAESLKFTEKKATVILVSDGSETGDVDDSAGARELRCGPLRRRRRAGEAGRQSHRPHGWFWPRQQGGRQPAAVPGGKNRRHLFNR